jgi:hypothetical protein
MKQADTTADTMDMQSVELTADATTVSMAEWTDLMLVEATAARTAVLMDDLMVELMAA